MRCFALHGADPAAGGGGVWYFFVLLNASERSLNIQIKLNLEHRLSFRLFLTHEKKKKEQRILPIDTVNW